MLQKFCQWIPETLTERYKKTCVNLLVECCSIRLRTTIARELSNFLTISIQNALKICSETNEKNHHRMQVLGTSYADPQMRKHSYFHHHNACQGLQIGRTFNSKVLRSDSSLTTHSYQKCLPAFQICYCFAQRLTYVLIAENFTLPVMRSSSCETTALIKDC